MITNISYINKCFIKFLNYRLVKGTQSVKDCLFQIEFSIENLINIKKKLNLTR